MQSEHFLYFLLPIQKVTLVFESDLHMAFAGLLLLPTFSQLPQLHHKDPSHGKFQRSASPGADPEKNLTRAQPKVRGCGYMGVALSMGSYRHDLVDAAQLSA